MDDEPERMNPRCDAGGRRYMLQDGGPAYPLQPASMPEMHYIGMSLRDYFAGQALAGMNAAERRWENGKSDMAVAAYSQADAMLAERENK